MTDQSFFKLMLFPIHFTVEHSRNDKVLIDLQEDVRTKFYLEAPSVLQCSVVFRVLCIVTDVSGHLDTQTWVWRSTSFRHFCHLSCCCELLWETCETTNVPFHATRITILAYFLFILFMTVWLTKIRNFAHCVIPFMWDVTKKGSSLRQSF